MTEAQVRGYKVYALIHSCAIAFLAVMTLVIPSAVQGAYPYPNVLAPYWVGFSQLLVAAIAFVSCE